MTDTELRNEIESELTGDILPFWRERVRDPTGRFIGEMDAEGRVTRSTPQSLILTTRLLWTYSAFYRWSQDSRDRGLASQAFVSLQTEFADSLQGGYVWSLAPDGRILEPHKKIYGQAFCIYALSEYYRATDDPAARDAAIELFELIERHAHDPARGGYFEVCHANWTLADNERLSDADQPAPKSMNTQLHMLEAYTHLTRIWPDDRVKQRLDDLLLIFNRRILSDDKSHLQHFFESNWEVCSSDYTYGHDIEASWLLCEAADILENPKRSKAMATIAKKLARATIDEGLGNDGGVFNTGSNGRPIDRSNIWWVQSEAIVGLLNMFGLTGDRQYLRATNQVWQFIRQHVVDRQHGDWHWRIAPDNRPDLSQPKVSAWKGPYHNGRMCLEVLHRLRPD